MFRLAPNSALCEKVKEEIQNGTFRSCDDVHVLAVSNRILSKIVTKQCVRTSSRSTTATCQKPSLTSLTLDNSRIAPMYSIIVFFVASVRKISVSQADDVNRLIASMPSLQRSLLLWLLDLCVEVSSHFRVGSLADSGRRSHHRHALMMPRTGESHGSKKPRYCGGSEPLSSGRPRPDGVSNVLTEGGQLHLPCYPGPSAPVKQPVH